MKSEILLMSEWQRILFGNIPWYFLLEVLGRTAGTYLMLLLGMRLLGKHVTAQYTLFEMAAVITLASAGGSALVVADNGILPPCIALVTVVLLHQLLSKWRRKKHNLEMTVVSQALMLIKDGQLLRGNMKTALISKKQVFEMLRRRRFQHLGQISRLYLESSGSFSIVGAKHPKPGLSVFPEVDEELHQAAAIRGHFACVNCGCVQVSQDLPLEVCGRCRSRDWQCAALELPGHERK